MKNLKKDIMKKVFLLCCLIPFLMATKCEDEAEITIFRNNFKIKITNESNLIVNDTMWIEGRVSSKAYDSKIADSIFMESPAGIEMSIYKLITPTPTYNAKDAIDKFDLIYPNQLIEYLGSCNNSTMFLTSTLNSNGNLYRFKIGLKAKSSGDYIIKFSYKPKIENTERNLDLLNNYQAPNNNYLVGFNSCGYTSSINQTNDYYYCFKVN